MIRPRGRAVRGLIVALAAAALARMLLNTARRFPYPFASSLARGLGVPLDHVTSLIAINQAASLASFLLGPYIDRVGPRAMMLAGMALLSVGMLAAGLIPVYTGVLIGLALAGLGKASYDPALLALVGQRVPFGRRGLAIGLIELAWAGSSLVGIPLAGLLIDRLGWQAPFIALGLLALVAAAVLALVLPPSERTPVDVAADTGARRSWSALARDPAARAGLAYALLFSMANDNLFVVYGAWLEQRFALTVVAIGTATTVIGVAEVAGEGLTATVADRIGLGRAALGGLVLTALGYLTLPLVGQTLPLALGALFVTFLAFEFTVVTALSLFTETLPGARATMMSALGASGSLGRVLGALIGGPVWTMGGLAATAIVSAILTTLALVCFAGSFRAVRAAARR